MTSTPQYRFSVQTITKAEPGRVTVSFAEVVKPSTDGTPNYNRVGGLNVNMSAEEAQQFFPGEDVYEMSLTKVDPAPATS